MCKIRQNNEDFESVRSFMELFFSVRTFYIDLVVGKFFTKNIDFFYIFPDV